MASLARCVLAAAVVPAQRPADAPLGDGGRDGHHDTEDRPLGRPQHLIRLTCAANRTLRA